MQRRWVPTGMLAGALGCTDAGTRNGLAFPPLPGAPAPETGAPNASAQAVVVVHLEPSALPRNPTTGLPSTERAERYFPDLLDLVALADAHDHRLTLMFSPQWAHHVQSSGCTLPGGTGTREHRGVAHTDCASLVRSFESQGHEIALHHHPLDAPSGWDGYTDRTSWAADRDGDGVEEAYFADGGGPHGPDPWHLGDLDAMMDVVEPVSAGHGVQSATTEEVHPDLRFSVAGGPDPYRSPASPGDLVSSPCAAHYGEETLWEVRMRLFTSASVQTTVLDHEVPLALADQAAEGRDPSVLGFVTHAKNVEEAGLETYEALFSTLMEAGIAAESVTEVMASHPRTEEDPSDAAADHQCAPASP